jgi:GNAT superfamily N-acetyltransferase
MSRPHPLAELIIAAAAGQFPVADGSWRRVPPWRPGLQAVFAFTGHAVLALAEDVPESMPAEFGVDGFGAAHDPRLICALAGSDGWIDNLDLVLSASAPSSAPAGLSVRSATGLVPRPDLADHPRVRHAAMIRSGPRVFGYPDPECSTVAILSEGLAGVRELSFELDPGQRGAGRGTALVRDALDLVADGELVVTAVAPGNAASLRSVLAAGFTPLGSVQLFSRPPHRPLRSAS